MACRKRCLTFNLGPTLTFTFRCGSQRVWRRARTPAPRESSAGEFKRAASGPQQRHRQEQHRASSIMGSQLCSRFPDGSDAVKRASQEMSGKSDQASIPCIPPLAANRHQRPVPRDYALRFSEQGARRGKYSITRKCLCAGGMLHAQAPAYPIPTMMAQPAYRHPSPEARGREPPPAWSQVRLSLGGRCPLLRSQPGVHANTSRHYEEINRNRSC